VHYAILLEAWSEKDDDVKATGRYEVLNGRKGELKTEWGRRIRTSKEKYDKNK
jgi:hypothetical protein